MVVRVFTQGLGRAEHPRAQRTREGLLFDVLFNILKQCPARWKLIRMLTAQVNAQNVFRFHLYVAHRTGDHFPAARFLVGLARRMAVEGLVAALVAADELFDA